MGFHTRQRCGLRQGSPVEKEAGHLKIMTNVGILNDLKTKKVRLKEDIKKNSSSHSDVTNVLIQVKGGASF